jgi:hypothetical protein
MSSKGKVFILSDGDLRDTYEEEVKQLPSEDAPVAPVVHSPAPATVTETQAHKKA